MARSIKIVTLDDAVSTHYPNSSKVADVSVFVIGKYV